MKLKQWNRAKAIALTGILALSVTLGSTGAPDASAKAKKATLKTKKISVAKGKTKTIKIKNKKKSCKYTFKSSKKKVATVTAKGKVKGIKAGKAKITVQEIAKKGKGKKRKVGVVTVTVTAKSPVNTKKPDASKAPDETPKPDRTQLPASADANKASVKVYIDSMEDSNLIAALDGVGIDPTKEPANDATPTPEPEPQVLLDRDFEDGSKAPFGNRGPEKVDVTDGGANGTAKAITVTGRTSNWNGITTDVTELFETGKSYEVSFYAKHEEAGTQNLNMSFQITDPSTEEAAYPSIKTIEVPEGDWTQFNITIPEVPDHIGVIQMYWQMDSSATADFSLDEIKVTGVQKGKVDAPDLSLGLPKTQFANPAISSRLTADPFAMEYDGRVYVYGTNDSQQYNHMYENGTIADNNYSQINTINVYSTTDMVNWTDHGAIDVKGAAKWTKNSWAPAACHKKINGKEKFFLYFADNGSGIGVLEADSPLGPWTDPTVSEANPKGKQLINRQTPGCSGDEVQWLFDPAVLIDDDGQGYLYFGGFGNSKGSDYNKNPKCIRVVKLGDDMTSIVGEPVMIDAPYAFEDSGINKFNGKYYYSYCTNFTQEAGADPNVGGGNIAVMESDNPMTGFKFIGTVLPSPPGGGNNHHCFIEFKGKYYAVYHAMKDSQAAGVNAAFFRSTYVTELNLGDNGNFTNADGSVAKSVSNNKTGVEPASAINPYEVVEAETFGLANGVGTVVNSEASVNPIWTVNCSLFNKNTGSYIGVANVDFGKDAAYGITMKMTDTDKNKYSSHTVALTKEVTGTHNVYFVFDKTNILVDQWNFIK